MRTLAMIVIAFAFVMIGISVATFAFAADGGVPVSTILNPIRPYLTEIVGIVAAAAVGWLLKRVRDWTGIEIEAKHRQALQSALQNAANLALLRAAGELGKVKVPIGNAIVEDGVEYVLRSVPDAVRHFGLSPDRIAELIRPKVAR